MLEKWVFHVDGHPGITGFPRGEDPYIYPPVDMLALASADELFMVTRMVFAMDGQRNTCTTASGTVDASRFDDHVVGCHVYNGAACDASQSGFVDINRPSYYWTAPPINPSLSM